MSRSPHKLHSTSPKPKKSKTKSSLKNNTIQDDSNKPLDLSTKSEVIESNLEEDVNQDKVNQSPEEDNSSDAIVTESNNSLTNPDVTQVDNSTTESNDNSGINAKNVSVDKDFVQTPKIIRSFFDADTPEELCLLEEQIYKQKEKQSSSDSNNSISTTKDITSSSTSLPPHHHLSQSIPHGNKVLKTISDLNPLNDIDCFVQLSENERLHTKEGKPFHKVTFRDMKSTIQASIWSDSPFFNECDRVWRIGKFYKIRGVIRNGRYGTNLEIKKIREVIPTDRNDGFDPNKCRPSSKISPEIILAEIIKLANNNIPKGPLLNLILRIFKVKRNELCELPASRSHHRAYIGGLLEHTLSVTQIALSLANHYLSNEASSLQNKFSKPLIVSGAILHDIGKLLDTQVNQVTPKHTLAGNLIGHAILGVEIIQQYSSEVQLDAQVRIQLEHIILTHSRFTEWGSPFPPSTLESMIVHYADYIDSTFISALNIINGDDSIGEQTYRKGPFGTTLYKALINR